MIRPLIAAWFPNLWAQFLAYRCEVLGHREQQVELLGQTWTFCDRCVDWKRGT